MTNYYPIYPNMGKRIKKKDRAEVDAMWDLLEEKKKKLAELEKIDSKKSRYKQGGLKRSITILNEKFCLRSIEILKG